MESWLYVVLASVGAGLVGWVVTASYYIDQNTRVADELKELKGKTAADASVRVGPDGVSVRANGVSNKELAEFIATAAGSQFRGNALVPPSDFTWEGPEAAVHRLRLDPVLRVLSREAKDNTLEAAFTALGYASEPHMIVGISYGTNGMYRLNVANGEGDPTEGPAGAVAWATRTWSAKKEGTSTTEAGTKYWKRVAVVKD